MLLGLQSGWHEDMVDSVNCNLQVYIIQVGVDNLRGCIDTDVNSLQWTIACGQKLI
jgi:hypothetical protein